MSSQLSQTVRKGCLLIASPEIENRLFSRSVMLVCEHNGSGSFALLVNKPLDLAVPSEFLDLASAPNKNISLRAGGPVQPNQMMLLHTKATGQQQLLPVLSDVFLGGDLRFLHELIEDASSPAVFLCFGYAGWATGQLEQEFFEGSWFAHSASKELLFETPPGKLWSSLLRGMGGRYACLSTIPEDPSLN